MSDASTAGRPAPTIAVVIPVYNKVRYVKAALDSVVEAARRHGRVELVFVDNGSTDGSRQALDAYAADARVSECGARTVAAVRNEGASQVRGELLSFLDCDCVVRPDYFAALERVFAETGASATGCEVGLPERPVWAERVWYDLHVVRSDGWRHYLNSGNFAVRRAAFDEVGGFDERMTSGEDTDICVRLRAKEHRIYESHALDVMHLDNPKTLGAFYRKQRWHGEGVLSGDTLFRLTKSTTMIVAHVALVAAAVALVGAAAALRAPWLLVLAALLVLAVPATAVAYRAVETRRVVNPPAALLLYTLFFFARAEALLRAAARLRVASRAARTA